MTDAGFPPTESECKHMQQVSEAQRTGSYDTEVQRLIYLEVQQLPLHPSYTVRKDRLNPFNDMI